MFLGLDSTNWQVYYEGGDPAHRAVARNIFMENNRTTFSSIFTSGASSGWEIEHIILEDSTPTIRYLANIDQAPRVYEGALTLSDGTDADYTFTVDQGTGTDPRIVWDDDVATFELDFDGNLADGLDPAFDTDSIFVPTDIIVEGSNDANETTLAFTDPTGDNTITFPDATGNPVLMEEANTPGENIIFEGATPDDFELTLAASDPAADYTITIPAKTGLLTIDSECFGMHSVSFNPNEAATEYISFHQSVSQSTTEANVDTFFNPVQIDIHSLQVTVDTTVATGSWAITLRDDGGDTSLTCTISTGTTCQDLSNVGQPGAASKLNFSVVPTSPTAHETALHPLTSVDRHNPHLGPA
jgi:hypothetical protein